MKDIDVYKLHFKKKLFGGVDEIDVVKKMQDLNSKYQLLMHSQKDFYEKRIEELEMSQKNKIDEAIKEYSNNLKIPQEIKQPNGINSNEEFGEKSLNEITENYTVNRESPTDISELFRSFSEEVQECTDYNNLL